jgi:protein-tyrosine-phosphatase/DNA-binding transcriptional ArsR family regulator
MNSEQNTLAARAARHAALADATRLRIVDLLLLGDVSPQEMQHRLDVASNLLAHHLKVLESASLISRHRSEGDRRRSYVRLNPDSLDDLGARSAIAAARVVFVCTANSARSQLAEHLWRESSTVPTASAGTVPAPSVARGALKVAAKHGLDLTDATPRLLRDIESEGDLRITVCDNAHESLGVSDLHWSIPDPVASGSMGAFEATYADLRRRISTLAPQIAAA